MDTSSSNLIPAMATPQGPKCPCGRVTVSNFDDLGRHLRSEVGYPQAHDQWASSVPSIFLAPLPRPVRIWLPGKQSPANLDSTAGLMWTWDLAQDEDPQYQYFTAVDGQGDINTTLAGD